MSLRPAGIGAEPKKLPILAGLLVAAGGTYYWMSRPDTAAGASPTPVTTGKAATATTVTSSATRTTTASYGPRTAARGRTSSSGDDFHPSLKVPEGMDISRIDP